MMSHKRRGQDDRKNERAGGSKRSRWSKQHLYLVLDDWDKGFSVHKIDADSFDDDSDSSSGSDDEHQQQYHHLADPPVLRFEAAAGNKDKLYLPTAGDDQTYLAASGTKMFIVMNNRCGLVYDVDTVVLAVGIHTPPRMVFGFGKCMPVGDVLYLLSYRLFDTDGQHSFEAMSWSPGGGWAWKTLSAPPPTFTARQVVVAHALHPDGCTIFMTTAYKHAHGAPVGTYSFNTREATWRWHGKCALPFCGQGHFDAELGAWVGLNFYGCICSCQVISLDFVRERPPKDDIWGLSVDQYLYLDHQTTKEKLFRKEGCTLSSSLTYMGAGRFCLLECVPTKVRKRRAFGDDDGCVLHITIFGLKYNHKGELETTNHRSTRSFIVSRHRGYFTPFAFWA